MDYKVGFCCKYVPEDGLSKIEKKESIERYNTKTTTVSFASKLAKTQLNEKLSSIITHNIKATYNLVELVGFYPIELRMLRLTSDLLPLYTHPVAKEFYKSFEIKELVSSGLFKIGELARKKNVRLGFHPGQFCVLNSKDSRVLSSSIGEFEYHVSLGLWLGYSGWHDKGFSINVHVGGREAGIEGFKSNLALLSKDARNFITIENDEFSFGLDEVLQLKEDVALVLDVHHHWCKTGEYVSVNDPRIKEIIDSWRGCRPLLHYSVSREDVIIGHKPDEKPDLNKLKESGFSVTELRAHSDFYWNRAVNRWIREFLPSFDIECESKMKNIASIELLNEIKI